MVESLTRIEARIRFKLDLIFCILLICLFDDDEEEEGMEESLLVDDFCVPMKYGLEDRMRDGWEGGSLLFELLDDLS